MKICVFGAGAVGGLIAARMAMAGIDVSIVARGAHLDAIRDRGLTLEDARGRRTVRVTASDDPRRLGGQDMVVLATKAHGLPPAAEAIATLLTRDTVLVPAQNGIPWWYFHREQGTFDGQPIRAADPAGTLRRVLPPEQVIGCVVYIAAEVAQPGVVRHASGERFIFGEPDGSASDRLRAVVRAFEQAGFAAEATGRIRDAIWLKLWGNLSLNPVSILTGATVDRMLADGDVTRVLRRMMEEARTVADRLGIRFGTTVDDRLAAAQRLGAFKTSMLQDFEAGRPIELEPLMGAVLELAQRLEIATPMLDAVHALARLRGATVSG